MQAKSWYLYSMLTHIVHHFFNGTSGCSLVTREHKETKTVARNVRGMASDAPLICACFQRSLRSPTYCSRVGTIAIAIHPTLCWGKYDIESNPSNPCPRSWLPCNVRPLPPKQGFFCRVANFMQRTYVQKPYHQV